jgi:hypothetical protein
VISGSAVDSGVCLSNLENAEGCVSALNTVNTAGKSAETLISTCCKIFVGRFVTHRLFLASTSGVRVGKVGELPHGHLGV